MPLTDKQGRPYALANDVSHGHITHLIADADFPCLGAGKRIEIEADRTKKGFGRFFVACNCASHRHFLDGQLGDDGEIIGFYPDASASLPAHA